MKKIIFPFLILLSFSTFADEVSCSSSIDFGGRRTDYKLEILEDKGEMYGLITIGNMPSVDYDIEQKTYEVREDLSSSSDDLNLGEMYIAQSMYIENELYQNSGVDLSQVRSVKLNTFLEGGRAYSNFGMTGFAETFDLSGKSLGPFAMVGLFISPCM